MGDKKTRKQLITAQRNEISEHFTYTWLAERTKKKENRKVLEDIAKDELKHYRVFRRLTKEKIKPRKLKVFWFRTISRVLGLSFGLKLMERGEEVTQQTYGELKDQFPELADIILDEQTHEQEILDFLEEERLQYAGSIVLGLNDALVELAGALAGLTFALKDSKVIAMAGFITGVAASMSMAASEYLSSREDAEENKSRSPLKSAAYTGVSYIITVMVLILPFLLIGNVYIALGTMLGASLLIILSYNFYITTAKGLKLWSRFGTMAVLSLAVAGISFLVGIAARRIFGVDV